MTKTIHFFVKIVCLFLIFVVYCSGLKAVDLQFTSHNCDEEDRRLTDSKYYTLSWNGQLTPQFCSFSFIGGLEGEGQRTCYNSRRGSKCTVQRDRHVMCFDVLTFDLPYSAGDVKLAVTNFTGSALLYSRYYKIDHTCIENGYKVNVSIILPPAYVAPNTTIEYIRLQITAKKMADPEASYLGYIIAGSCAGAFIIGVVVFTVFKARWGSFKKSTDKSEGILEYSSTVDKLEMNKFPEHSDISPAASSLLNAPTS